MSLDILGKHLDFDVTLIAPCLGHFTIDVTLKVYAHIFPTKKRM